MPDLTARAWECLNRARVTLDGRTLGVRASVDDTREKLNYDHCFVRDFAMCAPAFLLHGESGVVRDFLLTTIRMQAHTRRLRTFEPREGILPASFRPVPGESGTVLDADYGEESIARVTPIDSVFWWMITLRAYTVASGDTELANREECQEGIRRILRLVLEGSFEMFPTLLVPEGSFMIDRRMGVYGHPLEVQALFFMALRAAGGRRWPPGSGAGASAEPPNARGPLLLDRQGRPRSTSGGDAGPVRRRGREHPQRVPRVHSGLGR
jgi:hypothetical protein